MAFKVQSPGIVVASFATPQEIVIDHANDSIRVGDGTRLTTVETVGAQNALIVKPVGGGDASAANQTSGDQKTQIVAPDGTTEVEVDDVGGEKALKVSVIATVGGGSAPSYVDDGAFVFGTDSVAAMGAAYDATPDSVDDGDIGLVRMTAARILMTDVQVCALPTGAATSAKQDTIIGHVDGIETLIGTTNTTLTTIDGRVDGIEALLTTIDGRVDGIETLITSTNTKLDTLAGYEDGIEGILTTIDADTGSIMTAVQLLDDTIFVDDAGFTAATSKVGVAGGVYQASPNTLDDGDAGYLLLDTNHALQVVLRAGTAGFGKLTANSGVDIGDVDVTSIVMPTGASAAQVQGTVAHGTATGQNPVMCAYEARVAALNTLEAQGDVVRQVSDGYGRALHAGFFSPEQIGYQAPSQVTNTSEATIVTADANNCLDIISLIITNNSDVQSLATIKDSTGGTTRAIFLVPARGGVVHNPNTPMPQAAKNTAWTITMGTTATATNVSVMFGKRPT